MTGARRWIALVVFLVGARLWPQAQFAESFRKGRTKIMEQSFEV
jgi:hypothetical protein